MNDTSNIPLPTPAYLANCRWIQENLDHLVCQYPDQWIAVDGGRVVAAGADLGEVTRAAKTSCTSPHVAYEFIAGASMIF